jgi:hypothetical protein
MVVRAQQAAMPVIGWLSSQSAADDVRNVTAAYELKPLLIDGRPSTLHAFARSLGGNK